MIVHADCLEHLATLPADSIEVCITDPPYGLGAPPPIEDVLRAWLAGEPYAPKGRGFMGKSWDAFVPGPEIWREVYRVLRPGAHLAAFFGTRTYDVGTLAIRLAGFEIRDELAWLYGSGFPKSHDISKALAKAAGAEREGARKWEGWGTALKPAHEPIVLARKPFRGTVAQNVIAHGTGAIHVDACRIAGVKNSTTRTASRNSAYGFGDQGRIEDDGRGRWPANVLLDEGAAEMLDAQSGPSRSGEPRADRGSGGIWSPSSGVPCGPQYGDSGGASRFFYCAKASKGERVGGSEGHPTVKPQALMRWLVRLLAPPGATVLDPFAGSGSTVIAALAEGFGAIGIEREAAYVEIARERLRMASQA